MNYLFIIILNKCVYFITTRILLLFPDKKRLNTRYPINVCPRLKASFVMLHPHDCPVKTNHMIGVLIRFESKEE